jgi:UDP-GlcNAc:undecaprenyl-phosphate GlcNAc-1-phosphate transferase
MNFSNSPDFLLLNFVIGITSIILSYFATEFFLKLAQKKKILDDPKLEPERKKHEKPIPLLGGTGFVLTSLFLVLSVAFLEEFSLLPVSLTTFDLTSFNLIWIALSFVILLVGGYFDDKYNLSKKFVFSYIFLAILVAIIPGGLQIHSLSYPFDTVIPDFFLIPPLLSFLWLGFCTSATKFLDGHDGLVTSVGIITFLNIGAISLFQNVNQPLIFVFSMIWVTGLFGFLVFNFPNAKIYLGEGGSEAVGFAIGVFSILAGAKIATSSTVIGWFILDILFVIFLRKIKNKGMFAGDRLHWHFRLADLGMNKIQVLIITTVIILATAHSGLLVSTEFKPIILSLQALILFVLFSITLFIGKAKEKI